MSQEEKEFIEWLRKQRRGRTFIMRSNLGCPLDKFYLEHGTYWDTVPTQAWMIRFMDWFDAGDLPYSKQELRRNLDGVEDWIAKEEAR